MLKWVQISKKSRILLVLTIAAFAAVGGIVSALAYECQSTGYCISPFVPGKTSGEAINFYDYTITSSPGKPGPSILSLSIRNTGPSTVTIASLHVKDLASGYDPGPFQSNNSIPVGSTSTLTVDTSTVGFYFTVGHSYVVTVITTSNTQFMHNISY